jgi:hypothetical protein
MRDRLRLPRTAWARFLCSSRGKILEIFDLVIPT